MAKTCLDVNSGMPNVEDVEDRGSLGNGMGTVAGSWFSNQKKDIVRVGMYERTKQHHQAWQMACLNNLYDNFCRSEGISEATVRSRADVEKLLTKMFLKYGIHFYWDPDRVDPLADHPCDLMRHCRDRVPSWTADLLQVQNSGPFYHDQQIYLLQMFHISMCRCTATSLSSHSYVKKTIGDPLGKSLHHHVLQSVSEDQVEIWTASLLS